MSMPTVRKIKAGIAISEVTTNLRTVAPFRKSRTAITSGPRGTSETTRICMMS
jgi:hypothetical protein